MSYGNKLCLLRKQLLIFRQYQLSRFITRYDLEHRSCLLRDKLPGYDICMMLKYRNYYLVTGLKLRQYIGVCDKVYGLGRTSYKYDLLR